MQPYVLMIQADQDDAYLTESIFEGLKYPVSIQYVSTLKEVDDVIGMNGHPLVMLLNDVGASHRGGEILLRLKAHAAYGYIPVVVLGEVSTPEYIRKCYQAGASTFIVKPSSLIETQQKIESFFSYWLEVASVGHQ